MRRRQALAPTSPGQNISFVFTPSMALLSRLLLVHLISEKRVFLVKHWLSVRATPPPSILLSSLVLPSPLQAVVCVSCAAHLWRVGRECSRVPCVCASAVVCLCVRVQGWGSTFVGAPPRSSFF
eukprot:RCo054440